MERKRACLKCGSINPHATFDALEECPKCGAIYARVEASRMASASAQRPKKAPSGSGWRIGVFAVAALAIGIGATLLLRDAKERPALASTPAASVHKADAPAAPIAAKAEPVELPEVEAAKQALKAIAKDPDSVQFRNVKVVPGTKEVCGEYNARNGFGGYNGFQPFWVNEPTSDKPVVVTDTSEASLATIICKKHL